MKSKYSTVMFDLDGTVSESHPGIIASAKQAIADFNWPMPEDFDYRKFIGPPICTSLMKYAGMEERMAEKVMKQYRVIYNAGEIYNCKLYDGMLGLMEDLKKAGSKVCIATSKPQPMAENVIRHLGLESVLTVTVGADTSDKSSDKSILIDECLRITGDRKSDAVMIGDTRYDIRGAVDSGVDFIGVLYGYGSRQEMEERGAEVFAETVEHLRRLLLEEE